MLKTAKELIAVAHSIYGPEVPHKNIRTLEVLPRLTAENAGDLARAVGTTKKNLERIATATDPVEAAFGVPLSTGTDDDSIKKVRLTLGNLIIGRLAERAFETIYKEEMGSRELQLQDDRSARNDTDYRVLNGGGRPVFRINIKFFGSVFRKALELVGLDPADCFALATYKINQGIKKQEEEQLPYLFVIVGVPDLTGATVGVVVPEAMAHFSAFVHAAKTVEGKRAVEDAIVERLIRTDQPKSVQTVLKGYGERVTAANWYILSAVRADKLLRDLLFKRVYGVRVRAFARNYRGAELDMHFSLKDDLTPLRSFLATLRADGLPKVSHMFGTGKM